MPIDLTWTKFKSLLDVIVKHDVAGVTIANLSKDRSKVKFLDDLPETVEGSFSGKPTWVDSNNLIKQTYKAYGEKLVIIGVGGIFTAEDAYTKIKLGASLVELITGILFNGPQLAAEINDGLLKLLDEDGFTNISEAIGIDAKK
jgi:dihydroorotate dehydrogenase (fumarate)